MPHRTTMKSREALWLRSPRNQWPIRLLVTQVKETTCKVYRNSVGSTRTIPPGPDEEATEMELWKKRLTPHTSRFHNSLDGGGSGVIGPLEHKPQDVNNTGPMEPCPLVQPLLLLVTPVVYGDRALAGG
ncbi:uncharacterized protein [Triticum aestivum]|uniref:uncharacterized protein n=1 Tax=Triticum aestivum TaxID=4565 RepID=UPI001D034662|nr:uncharacterized protein LOC123087471 [Triticum aestivum]XP_044423444.1 uncharacterized protein LOC123148145 [Triticum aestivum]